MKIPVQKNNYTELHREDTEKEIIVLIVNHINHSPKKNPLPPQNILKKIVSLQTFKNFIKK